MFEVPTMLTVKEVSIKAGLSCHYIRNLIFENKIVYVKTGNKYLINFEKFITFLNQGEQVQEETSNVQGTIRRLS